MQKLSSFLLAGIILLLGIIVYQQNQSLIFQKIQIKQQFHSDLVLLLSLTDDSGLSKLLSKGATEFSAKDQNLVALLIQRLIIVKDLKPAFTESEWQTIVTEGREAFKLPIFRLRWDAIKSYYDKDVVDFVEKTFIHNPGEPK